MPLPLSLPMMRRISASLHLGSRGPHGQSSLSHLQWWTHVPDGGLELVHVFLLVKYLLHGSGQMRPEAGVGTGRLRDPLLQRPVGVAPRLLKVVMLRVQEVVHLGPQPLRLRPGS